MRFGRGLLIGSVGWPANRLAGRFRRATKAVLAFRRKTTVGQMVTRLLGRKGLGKVMGERERERQKQRFFRVGKGREARASQ